MNALQKLILFLFPKTIYQTEDRSLRVVDKVEYGRLVRVLYDHGVRESGVFLEKSYWNDPLFFYMRTLKELSQTYVGIDRALLIGGGGMAFCRYFFSRSRMNTMTVV